MQSKKITLLGMLVAAVYVHASASLASTTPDSTKAKASYKIKSENLKFLSVPERNFLAVLEQCSTQECLCALEKTDTFIDTKAKPGAYLIKQNVTPLWEYIDSALVDCKDEIELNEGLNEGEIKEQRAAADIMNVIKKRTPRLKNIYNRELKVKQGLQGKVTLKFTIGTEGDIVSMSIVSSTTGDDDFDKKIKADVSKWKFDRIKTGKTTVTIPFTFSEDDE